MFLAKMQKCNEELAKTFRCLILIPNNTQHKDETDLFISDIFRRISIFFKQFVIFLNFLRKLVRLLANEMMQTDVMLIIFVDQFIASTSPAAASLQRISRDWKHLILQHFTINSDNSWTLTAELCLE